MANEQQQQQEKARQTRLLEESKARAASANGEDKTESLEAKLARLEAENAKLRADAGSVKFKVSEKGAMSIYGLGRFPVTLYCETWIRVLDMANNIREFIKEHPELKRRES